MLDLQKLETFVVLVRTNSFNRAAKELHCAQSTVTFRIKAIEKELGVRLFNRERFTHRITLTDSGRSTYEQAVKLLALANGVRDKVSERQGDGSRT